MVPSTGLSVSALLLPATIKYASAAGAAAVKLPEKEVGAILLKPNADGCATGVTQAVCARSPGAHNRHVSTIIMFDNYKFFDYFWLKLNYLGACATLRQPGNSIPIMQCSSLLNLVKRPLTTENIRTLQRVTCGFDGHDPKVSRK